MASCAINLPRRPTDLFSARVACVGDFAPHLVPIPSRGLIFQTRCPSKALEYPIPRPMASHGMAGACFFCLGRGLSFFFFRAICSQAQLSCSSESWPSLVPLAAGTSPEFSLLDFTLLSVFSRSPNLGSQRQSWNRSN